MPDKLFIYYRIPKADVDLGLMCAKKLLRALEQQNLGTGELFLRNEAGKPYVTLMEVICPATQYNMERAEEFNNQLAKLANTCFADLPSLPVRHTELFSLQGT